MVHGESQYIAWNLLGTGLIREFDKDWDIDNKPVVKGGDRLNDSSDNSFSSIFSQMSRFAAQYVV